MNSVSRFKEIIDKEFNSEFTILCGAGISINSGLPSADDLKRTLLEKIFQHGKNEIDELITSDLPFEGFMEAILSISANPDILLNIFGIGEPNTNHILVAKLAKLGLIKTIYTTNFDVLIEKALLKEHLEYQVYYFKDRFKIALEDSHDKNKIKIFKLHGSIEDMQSIKTTLEGVASRSSFPEISTLLEHLFFIEEHKKILVIGYSFSDNFDINPLLMRLGKHAKKTLLISHSTSKKNTKEIDRQDQEKEILKEFSGLELFCNADDFIKALWLNFQTKIGPYQLVKSEPLWHHFVNEWSDVLDKLGDSARCQIAGYLFNRISNYEKSIEYAQKALNASLKGENKSDELHCYLLLSNCMLYLERYEEQRLYCLKALEIAMQKDDKRLMAICDIDLGTVDYSRKSFASAKDYFERALKEVSVEDIHIKLNAYIGLSIAHHGLGEYYLSMDFSNKALEIASEIGDMIGEASGYMNRGLSYLFLDNVEAATRDFEKAMEIAKKVGNQKVYLNAQENIELTKKLSIKLSQDRLAQSDENLEVQSLVQKALEAEQSGNLHNAIVYYDKALSINSDIVYLHYNKGTILKELGKLDDAIDCYDKATDINPKHISSWKNKGVAQVLKGNFREAIKCYEKAIELDSNYFDIWYDKGVALFNLNLWSDAIYCFDKELASTPTHIFSLSMKGVAFGMIKDYKKAIQCFDEILKIDPQNAMALKNKDIALRKLGN